PGRLEVLRPRRPRDVLPGVARVARALRNRERPGPQPAGRLCLEVRREGEAVLALDGTVLGLEETGGDRRVVPHRHLPGLILRQALVVARVRGILLAGVLNEVRVEVERVLKGRLIDLCLVGLAVRLRRPPGAAERVQDGRERGAKVTPAGLATQ